MTHDAKLQPGTEAELADVIRSTKGGLHVTGGGTRAIGRAATGKGLSTAGLSGITLYEPGAMTMVSQAGTPLADITAVLTKENQRLSFEPMDHRGLLGTKGTPTLGGVFATNTSGPRRVQAGAARDFALGVRFVDGSGDVISNGGRVMKNVTGYDLVKLMCGSWGRLGVLSEVSFKTLPVPETAASLAVDIDNPEQAVMAMSAAFASPYDVTGAAYLRGQVHIRIEGFEQSVSYRSVQLTEILGKFGSVSMTDDIARVWADIRDVAPFHGTDGDVWKISVKPTDGPRVMAAVPGSCLLDWGGGLVWANVPAGTDVRALIADVPGHATCVRGTTHDTFPVEEGALAILTQGVRAKFDPRGIFNQGHG